MSIEVSEVRKLYGLQEALKGISFELKTGEVVGFLGPNGAGKSTMMKILTGYLPATSGTANVCGFNVAHQALEVKRRIGYLPEHNPLYTEMYIREYLRFVGGVFHVKELRKRVEEVIAQTGLQKEQHKKISQLSKGYRQRVGLAQALIHNPDVLILDEPTSGLDPIQLGEIRKLIREVGRTKTVMLSTHIMQEVEAVCDRAIIITSGEIVADDKVSALRSHASKTKRFRLRFATPVPMRELQKISGVEQVSEHSNTSFSLFTNSQFKQQHLFDLASSQGYQIEEFNSEGQNLEEIFLRLTQDDKKRS